MIYRILLGIAIVWLAYRIFIRPRVRHEQPRSLNTLDLKYCAVCRSYVSSLKECGHESAPENQK